MVFLIELLRNRTLNEAACAPFFWNQHSSFFVVNLCQRIYQSVHPVCLTDLQTVNGGISAGWFAGKNFQYFYLLRIFTSITVGHYIFWVPHTHTHLSAGGLLNYLIAVIYHQSNKDMVFQMIGSDLVYINALRVKVVSIQKKKER